MSRGILQRLADGVVLGDGGYVLELEKRGYVQAGPFTPEVCIEHPEAVEQLHAEFIHAGAEVIQALAFYASEEKLATIGLSDKWEEINRAAVRLARKTAASHDVLVAGDLCTTWVYDPASAGSANRVRELIDRQIEVQLDEGVDFFIAESFYFLGEAKIALEQVKQTGVPAIVTMLAQPASQDGFSSLECARQLADAGADAVGLNCLRNPANVLPMMREICEAVSCYVACQAAGYRTPDHIPDFTAIPEFPHSMDGLQLCRQDMGDYARQAKEMGIRYIGSCCGSVASHVREMARALGKVPAQERNWKSRGKAMSAYEHHHSTQA